MKIRSFTTVILAILVLVTTGCVPLVPRVVWEVPGAGVRAVPQVSLPQVERAPDACLPGTYQTGIVRDSRGYTHRICDQNPAAGYRRADDGWNNPPKLYPGPSRYLTDNSSEVPLGGLALLVTGVQSAPVVQE